MIEKNKTYKLIKNNIHHDENGTQYHICKIMCYSEN